MMKSFSDEYLKILTTDYATLNLTRILDPQDFFEKQILDSELPLDKSPSFEETLKDAGLCIDVGFGGGFPLLVLAKRLPEVQFLGFEARGKKAKAVQDIANKLGLKNVKTFHQRLENVLFDREAVITFKAVGKVDDLLKRVNSQKQVVAYFYKGPGFDEQEDLSKVLKKWDKFEDDTFVLPAGEERRFLGFENKNVPCGTITKKDLVKVSSFV